MEKTRNYHDHVIKDGQFIGRFEEMYQEFEDPWHQSIQPNLYARHCGILHMKRYEIGSVIEFGSGLGYYSNMIHQMTGIIPVGYDLSETAITKAKQRFPHLDHRLGRVQDILQKTLDADAILFAEIGWYILDDLDLIMDLLLRHQKGKYFINNQVFYKGSQQYGTEYFTTLDQYIDRIPLKLIARMEATTVTDSTIETSSIFRIEAK